MQPKYLIIFAIAGITALAIFNIINSHHTKQAIAANQAATSNPSSVSAAATTPTASSIAQQPKAILDKANSQIYTANQQNADHVAQADKAAE